MNRIAIVLCTFLLYTGCPPTVEDFVEPPPPSEKTEELPGLAGMSWEWQGVKLYFSDTKVRQNYTSHIYTYDTKARTGRAETLGAFSVDAEFLKLIFANFPGAGETVFDNMNAGILNTKWRLNNGILGFKAGTVNLHGGTYAYVYDAEAGTGTAGGIKDSRGGEWNRLGPFTITDDIITFTNYKESGMTVRYTKEPAGGGAADTASLLGTDWWWDSTSLHLEFITETVTLLWSSTGYYEIPILFDYTFAGSAGRVYNGRNAIGTKYDLGSFSISATGKTLSFLQYGPYPHGADFIKQE